MVDAQEFFGRFDIKILDKLAGGQFIDLDGGLAVDVKDIFDS